jgi:hypothetical protein
LILGEEGKRSYHPIISWEVSYHSGGLKTLILQPGGHSAEFLRDLLTLFLSGHFLVLKLVQFVLGRDTNAYMQ